MTLNACLNHSNLFKVNYLSKFSLFLVGQGKFNFYTLANLIVKAKIWNFNGIKLLWSDPENSSSQASKLTCINLETRETRILNLIRFMPDVGIQLRAF